MRLSSLPPAVPSRPGFRRALGAVALGLFAANCGLDKLTSNESAVSAVTFRLTGDTVLSVGVSRPYAIAPSAPVDFSQLTVAIETSDSTLARLDSIRGQTAWVTGRRNGNARVRLTVRAPELPAGRTDSALVRVRFGAIRIDPIDTIAGLGAANNANQRTVVVRGTRPDGSPAAGAPTVTATLVSRDTARLRSVTPGSNVFVARDTGLVWLVATFDGVTDSVRVPIRRRITRVVADSFAFGALFTSRSVPLRVLDAGDSAIVGAAYRISGIDTLRLQVDSTSPGASATAPRLRARIRDTASFLAASGAVTSPRTRTRVVQVPANIVLGGGGGQSARFGTAVPVAPRIIVRDSGGQGVQGVAVTFSVPNAGNGSVTGATQTTNAAGEATVGSWVLGPNSGTDSLVATIAGLPSIVVTATALAGTPVRVRFVSQPQGGGSNVRVTPPPQVAVQDSVGNTVTSAADSITVTVLTVAGNGTGGTFSGATSRQASGGIAVFDSLTFSDTTSAVRLIATRPGLAPDTSAPFPIGRPATAVVFTANPVDSRGGVRMAPVTVEFRDASGRRASGATDSVTIAIDNTPSVTLTGTLRRAAVAGVVTFDDLVLLGGANENPQFRVQTTGGLTALSTGFRVLLGPASLLRFERAPANVSPNVSQGIEVVVADSGGNRVFNTSPTVVLRLLSNPGGAVITDSIRVANNGSAFFNFSLATAGTGYTLQASSVGFGSAVSAPFNVRQAGPPVRLRFLTKAPWALDAGRSVLPTLELLDSAGVRATVPTRTYTLSILSGPAGAVVTSPVDSQWFSGTTQSRARLRVSGSYRLVASGPGLTPDTSGPVNNFPAPVSGLAMVSQPQAASTGSPLGAVQVALVDSLGNVAQLLGGSFVDNSAVIAVAGQTAGGATLPLTGRLTRTVVNSVATFDSVIVSAAGAGNRLVFSSTAVTGVTSDTFSVRAPGTPRQLRVSPLPTTINGGSRFSPAFRVSVTDSIGTTVPSRTDSITLTLRGPAGAVLSGPVRVAAVNGVASFPTLGIPRADSGLRIVATSNQAGIAADSTPIFRVNVGPPSRLRLVSAPTSQLQAGIAGPIVFAISDSGVNTITTATDSVALFGVGVGVAGRNRTAAVAGIATFDSVSVGGTAGSLSRVSATGLSRGFSLADTTPGIAIRVGPPARVRLVSGISRRSMYFWDFSATVIVADAASNLVDTSSRTITASLIGGPAGAQLLGSSATASNGTARFSSMRVLTAGTGYRIVFSSPGLIPDTTPTFTIVGNPVRAVVLSAPTTGVRNGLIGPVRVAPADSAGNALAFSGTVILATASDPSVNGTLSQTSAFSGDTIPSVTFNTLRASAAGPVRLRFTLRDPSGQPMTDSVTLSLAPYSAAQSLAFVTQPASLVAGSTMATAPVVAIRDSVGNTVTDSAGRTISLSLGTNPGSAFLSGPLSATQAPGSGTVSFPGLSLNNAGVGYSLLASSPGVNAAASQLFNAVTTTDAVALRFVNNTVPSSVTANAPLVGTAGTLQVEVINSTGARVTSSTVPITLSIQGGRAAVDSVATVAAVNGVATFSGARLTRADTNYFLVATAPPLVQTTAATAVTVAPAAASRLALLDPIPSTVAGRTWPTLRVAVTDAFGNIVTSSTATVTLRGAQSFPGDSSYLTGRGNGALGGVGAAAPVLSQVAVNGIASFAGIRPRSTVSSNGTFNTLYFDAAGLTSLRTPGFNVTPAPSAFLGTQQTPFKTLFLNNERFNAGVWAYDSLGNGTQASGTLTVSITRRNGAALPAGVTVGNAGVSLPYAGTFARVDSLFLTGLTAADTIIVNASLTGTAGTITTRPSSMTPIAFAPFGPAAQLRFVQQPTNAARNTNVSPSITVAVTDTLGNRVTDISTGVGGVTGTITLDLPNGSTVGGVTTVLGGSGPINIVNGLATFPAVQVNNAGTGFQMRAQVTTGTTVPGVTSSILSSLFNITP